MVSVKSAAKRESMEVSPEKIEEIQEEVADSVVSCSTCVPWAEGEPIWFAPHTDLDDHLGGGCGYEPEEIEAAVEEGLRCPGCGADLDMSSEVGLKSDYDREVEKLLAKSSDPAVVEKLKRFSDFLSDYPYLGSRDPEGTGIEIIEAIEEAGKSTLYGGTYYRARLFDEQSRIYSPHEMGAPNPTNVYIREGRYNHTGQSFLYLSQFEDTALAEVATDGSNICVIQKYQVDNMDEVLKLEADYQDVDVKLSVLQAAIIYNGFIARIPEKTSSWKPEYFVTRFLADVARMLGFSAISFSSAVSYGDNLVLFNPDDERCKQVGEPYAHELKPPRSPFATVLPVGKK